MAEDLPPPGSPEQTAMADSIAFAIVTLPLDEWDAALKHGLDVYRERLERDYGDRFMPVQLELSMVRLRSAVLRCMRALVVASNGVAGHS